MKIIDDYIELEKLRYDERLKINIFKNIRYSAVTPPLLYLSLVENAFKHSEKISGNVEINIFLETDLNFIIFKVENHFSKKISDDETARIGLKNINKQLELYYTDSYSLEIEKPENWFSVKVTTPLRYD